MATQAETDMNRALTALYLEVPESVGRDINQKVRARVEELEAAGSVMPEWLRNMHLTLARNQDGDIIGVELSALLLTERIGELPEKLRTMAQAVLDAAPPQAATDVTKFVSASRQDG
jgi:hypothetical protein